MTNTNWFLLSSQPCFCPSEGRGLLQGMSFPLPVPNNEVRGYRIPTATAPASAPSRLLQKINCSG